jgi:hypothetical protein
VISAERKAVPPRTRMRMLRGYGDSVEGEQSLPRRA